MSLRVNKFIFLRRKQKAERGLLFTKKKKKGKKKKEKERNCEIIFQYEERGLLIAIDYSSMK